MGSRCLAVKYGEWQRVGGHRSQFLDGRCGLQPSRTMQNGNKPMRNISIIYYYNICIYIYRVRLQVAPHPEEKRVRNRNPWVVPSCCVAYTGTCLPSRLRFFLPGTRCLCEGLDGGGARVVVARRGDKT